MDVTYIVQANVIHTYKTHNITVGKTCMCRTYMQDIHAGHTQIRSQDIHAQHINEKILIMDTQDTQARHIGKTYNKATDMTYIQDI